MATDRKYRLLSIDGGGIRGIVPALVLAHIERLTNRPTFELFDAIAGTSTGGILALGLTKPGARVGTAAELAKLYEDRGRTIFARNLIDKIAQIPVDALRILQPMLPQKFDLTDLFQPRYCDKGKREVFGAYFENTMVSEATRPLFITSYDTERRSPVFFVSDPKQENETDDYYDAVARVSMLDAALATSAAPTYFPPHKIQRRDGQYFSLVDGGIFANNPTGLAHAFLRGADYAGDLILSLGTGSMHNPYPFDTIRKWGTLVWAAPALKMTFDGQTEAVAVVMRRRLENASYLRVQAILGAGASDDLDDVTEDNLQALKQLADALITKHAKELDVFCKQLVDQLKP